MKTLKLGLFSLLATLAVSVFLTSCEQQLAITTETEFSEEPQPDEILSIFKLPEEFNGMSEEELETFFKNTSEEELSEIMIVVTQEDIEMRCNKPWKYIGTRCRNNVHCGSGEREQKRYRRWCGWQGWQWAWGDWRYCCN